MSENSINQKKPQQREEKGVDKQRHYISIFYLAFSLLVGIPVWLYTTSPTQYPIPYGSIENLISEKSIFGVSVNIVSLNPQFTDGDLTRIKSDLESSLNQGIDKIALDYEIRVSRKILIKKDITSYGKAFLNSSHLKEHENNIQEIKSAGYNFVLIPNSWVSKKAALIREREDKIIIYIPYDSVENVSESINTLLSRHLLNIDDLIEPFEGIDRDASRLSEKVISKRRPDEYAHSSLKRVKMSPSLNYEIAITLVSAGSDGLKYLDVGPDTLAHRLRQFVQFHTQGIHPSVKVNIFSQTLHAVNLKEIYSPKKDSEKNEMVYDSFGLNSLVNGLESYLDVAQRASYENPVINLVFAISPKLSNATFKLDLDKERTQHAIIPGYGALFFLNNIDGASLISTHSRELLDVLRATRVLLGMPDITTKLPMPLCRSGAEDSSNCNLQYMLEASVNQEGSLVKRWQLHRWLLSNTAGALASTELALTSLIRLLQRLPFMVIREEIAARVASAVNHWQRCRRLLLKQHLGLGNSSSLDDSHSADALTLAVKAKTDAETAFFDPSLLELLYFPEDQKFGIYLPLFAPISIPIVTSSIKGIQALLKKE